MLPISDVVCLHIGGGQRGSSRHTGNRPAENGYDPQLLSDRSRTLAWIILPNQWLRSNLNGRYRAGLSVARIFHPAHDPFMRVVVSSNNVIRLSFLTALLADAGIEAVLLDNHTSILEGSAGAIPRRLVVSEDDFRRACLILREAGEW